MRMVNCFGIFAASVVLVAGFAFGPPIVAEDKGKAAETKVVPRDAIFGPGGPAKTKGWTDRDQEQLAEIREVIGKTGPSNIFLVAGDDAREAVRATWTAYNQFGGSAFADWVLRVRPEPDAKGQLPPGKKVEKQLNVWVFAYLGSESSERWSFKAVERTGTRIRVSYADILNRPGGGGSTVGDVVPYLVWAPLGALDPGKYTVELYEAHHQEAKLTRVVRLELAK